MSDKLQLVIRYRTASGSDRPLVELTYEKRNEPVATARGSVTINGKRQAEAYRTKRRQVVQRDPNHSPSKEEPSMRHQLQFLRVVFVAIALVFGLTGIAVAQETTGSLVGTVKDPNGAAVAGATVTITNSDTKLVVRTVTTNDAGEFSAPLLPVAFYDITVEATAFKKNLDQRVKLNVNER